MRPLPIPPPAEAARAWRWPLAVLLLGILLTALATLAVYRDRTTAAHAEFERLSERVAVETERRFTLPVYGLKGARGVYATGANVGLNEFRAYVGSSDLPREFPGIRGFGFIERVRREEAERFATAARVEGAPGFAVKTGGDAAEMYVIKYVEPLATNAAALGFDVGSEPNRRAAVEQAITTGRPTLTAPVTLLQDQRRSPGFLMLLPVYRTVAVMENAEDRRRHLIGVLYAPIIASELLRGVASAAGNRLDIGLFDGPDTHPSALLYNDGAADSERPPATASAADGAPGRASRFSSTRSLRLGERIFTIRTATTPAFDAIHSHATTAFVALAGLALSLLAAWGAWLQATGRARVETRARALTAEIQGLARIVERTSHAVTITDAQARVVWVNEGFTRLSGYTLQECSGRRLGALLGSGHTDPDVLQRLDEGYRNGVAVSVDVVNRTKDGRIYWLHLDAQPTFDAAGKFSGYMEIGTDITAIRQAENKLRESRDQATALAAELETMALVARHTTNAVVVTDANRRVRWVNAGFTRITGYSAEEAVGRSPGALLQCERTDPAVVGALRAAVNAGDGFKGELINRGKTGHDYWIDIQITPLHDTDGRLSGFVAIESDISDRKAAEVALAQERNWLAHIVAGTNAGEGEVNVQTGELHISERWAAMLGYTLEEIAPLAGNMNAGLYHPDDLPGARQALRRYLDGETPHHEAEFRMRHRDGHWIWVQARGSVTVWDAQGRPEWLSGVHFDITERRRATDQLRESLALVDALFEALPVPVVLKDTQHRYQRMNKAYAELFHTDAASLLGKTARDLISPEAAQRHFDEDQAILNNRGTCSYEVHQELSGGRRFDALISKAALTGPDGQVMGLVGTAVDISQRMDAERAMAEAKAAAEAANSAKSAFLATMSHEIRTPMNGVVGMAELLTHSPLDDEQVQTVRTIIESGQALLGLIDDILDFSKIEAGRMELDVSEFAITPLVEGVCATLLPLAAGRDVRLTVWVDAAVIERVIGDALRVRQVLTNLIGNAIKFSARQDGLPGRVSVQVQHDGSALRFCVDDNGIGMDRATVERLFTPFTQAEVSTTRRFGGTGLGLAICRRLVELMDGRIEVRSEPGLGSTFSFTLPLPVCAAQPAATTPLLAGLRCLLVGEPDVPSAQLRQWLEEAGAQVLGACNLAEARLAALATRGPADPGEPVIILHTDTQAALALPDTPGHPLRQMVIGYGRREATRTLTPTVASIDLLRREPFVTGMALLAGRVAAEPNAPLKAEDLKCGRIPPTLEQARAAGRLILVAEDDATNRAVLKRQLAVLGHAAEFAHDGRQALSCWRAGNHAMLLTDLHMPEMDGYALTTLIREEEGRGVRARLPIVALTANALKGEVVRARAVGMDDYLAKPVPLALLRATLNAWMPVPPGATALVEPIAAEPATSLATASATLNLQTLRDLIGDDADALHGLLADFAASARQHAADLRAALRAGDAQAVSAVAHKLKSASRSVGARALGDACAVLEAAAVAGASALQPVHRERFDDAFDAAMASLQAHLDPLPI